MDTFAGTTVLISGSARGQGAAHAEAFYNAGASVVITDVLDTEGRALAERLGPDRAMYAHLDVAVAAEWDDVVGRANRHFGPVTVLVNNAGIAGRGSGDIHDLDPLEFARVMDVNLMGALHGTQAVTPGMRDAGGGSIVNISSMLALNGRARTGAYTVSKWALRGLTKCAAVDLARDQIRVNAILPGLMENPMNVGPGIDPGELFARNESHLLLKRLGRAEDITPMVLFLASSDAAYVTGADIVIDGGWTAT